jgi:hypothetical protein
MMKVYRLTYGEYSNVMTIGIYATNELAEAQVLRDVFNGVKVESPNIEETEVIERLEDIR